MIEGKERGERGDERERNDLLPLHKYTRKKRERGREGRERVPVQDIVDTSPDPSRFCSVSYSNPPRVQLCISEDPVRTPLVSYRQSYNPSRQTPIYYHRSEQLLFIYLFI